MAKANRTVNLLWDNGTRRFLCSVSYPGNARLLTGVPPHPNLSILGSQKEMPSHPGTSALRFLMMKPDELLRYVFDRGTKTPVEDPDMSAVTPELIRRAHLMDAKATALDRLTGATLRYLSRYESPGSHTDLIHLLKKQQAQDFRDCDYDENQLEKFLFVWQYSEVKGLSPRQAADEILLQAQFFEALLWKTEGLTLKYQDKFLAAETLEEVLAATEDLQRESYVNAQV